MSPWLVFAAVLLYTTLTVAYVKGVKMVERVAPDNLVKFHFIMVAIRFLLSVTLVGIYVLFSKDRTATIHFAALVVVLYLAMIVVTLILKH
ncbi:MAG: hypothetical protein IKH88_00130 [Prevotella sp.]|nr:hypothetical protein [Prevotella sp.]MBR7054550.1 hypothetical protein [Prevotella sp.]